MGNVKGVKAVKLAIADPPYLGRAVRYYGQGGCGYGYGHKQADNHPEAHLWDDPETHKELAQRLLANYDGFAIALTVHSLSTYLQVLETDSRNGIRVGAWIKPIAIPSGSRIKTSWEPVIFKIPKERRGYAMGDRVNDYLIANPPKRNFIGSKPKEWTEWVLKVLGYEAGDEVHDLFVGSGAVSEVLANVDNSSL